jgi:hypothetical protein
MLYLHVLALLLGGILGMSGLIVAQKPEARKYLDMLTPFQALIGVALLAVSLLHFLQLGPINLLKLIEPKPVWALGLLGGCLAGVILGFLLGLPQILKIAPAGSPAGDKARDLASKLVPFQMLFGLVCFGAGALVILIRLDIVKPH